MPAVLFFIFITSIPIHNNIKYIGYEAFFGCKSLTSVNIPNSVRQISNNAFNGCTGLKTLLIGSGVTEIWDGAFSNCENLMDVYFYAENPPKISFPFVDATYSIFQNSLINYATLHVPANSLDIFSSTSPWSNFGKIVALTDEETDIKTMENESNTTTNYFLLNGQQVKAAQKGINILKKGKMVMKIIGK